MHKKYIWYVVLYVIIAVVVLPLLVLICCGGVAQEQQEQAKQVYGLEEYLLAKTTKQPQSESLNELESYVLGVVAGEMPALFPMEALKAQAVAARTYQVRYMQQQNSTEVIYDIEQAYIDTEAQKQKWGEQYETYHARIQQAVLETEGEILVYDEMPILAVFHAQSGGKTENSENVWVQALPYLRSVDSSGDLSAPDNTETITISETEFKEALSTYCEFTDTLTISDIVRSEAGYVLTVNINGQTVTGQNLRTALGLRSTDFTIVKENDTISITTQGYGHGAGMSQYGAKTLAEQGANYQEILYHYYTDVTLEKLPQ